MPADFNSEKRIALRKLNLLSNLIDTRFKSIVIGTSLDHNSHKEFISTTTTGTVDFLDFLDTQSLSINATTGAYQVATPAVTGNDNKLSDTEITALQATITEMKEALRTASSGTVANVISGKVNFGNTPTDTAQETILINNILNKAYKGLKSQLIEKPITSLDATRKILVAPGAMAGSWADIGSKITSFKASANPANIPNLGVFSTKRYRTGSSLNTTQLQADLQVLIDRATTLGTTGFSRTKLYGHEPITINGENIPFADVDGDGIASHYEKQLLQMALGGQKAITRLSKDIETQKKRIYKAALREGLVPYTKMPFSRDALNEVYSAIEQGDIAQLDLWSIKNWGDLELLDDGTYGGKFKDLFEKYGVNNLNDSKAETAAEDADEIHDTAERARLARVFTRLYAQENMISLSPTNTTANSYQGEYTTPYNIPDLGDSATSTVKYEFLNVNTSPATLETLVPLFMVLNDDRPPEKAGDPARSYLDLANATQSKDRDKLIIDELNYYLSLLKQGMKTNELTAVFKRIYLTPAEERDEVKALILEEVINDNFNQD